jgi:pimeloyl-ACP methyl ester carboxylesterase
MFRRIVPRLTIFAFLFLGARGEAGPAEVLNAVEHGYADSGGVKIHYAAIGSGPLVVMIHGFPDYWMSWYHQMEALAGEFRVVAIDLRGFNLSDKPKGVDNYDISLLVGDVAAVVRNLGSEKAVIVGHDWGGAIAWAFAMMHPEMTERLVICNLPHPRGFRRELANNPVQQANSGYARAFQMEGSEKTLTAEGLAEFAAGNDDGLKAMYVEAFERSDFEAMMNYYRKNYPREPYLEDTSPVVKVQVPVLMFHGLADPALGYKALNDTWEWLEKDLTLVTVPGAGHWVHHDAAELVSETMKCWLKRK